MENIPLIEIDGYWKDTKENFEGYLIKQTSDYDESDPQDEEIFYFGLSEEAIKKTMNQETAEDFVITAYRIAA